MIVFQNKFVFLYLKYNKQMIKVSFILNRYYEVLQQRIEALREIDRLKQELARKDIIIRRLQTQSYSSKSERCKNVTQGEWNLRAFLLIRKMTTNLSSCPKRP